MKNLTSDFENGALRSAMQVRDAAPVTRTKDMLTYAALSLTGEAGEVAEKVKKIMRDRAGVIVYEDREAILAEVGDVVWSCIVLLDSIGYSLDDAIDAMKSKCDRRLSNGTIHGSGDNR